MPAMKNAGRVKMAPAATLPPIEPTVRAAFSSRMVPPRLLMIAMPSTAVV